MGMHIHDVSEYVCVCVYVVVCVCEREREPYRYSRYEHVLRP
jgi:hypothetical protein